MGVGGLLMEIESARSRARKMAEPRRGGAEIAALVLAAGRASRYREAGGAEATKLVAEFRGEPLVRWAVRAALGSRASPVIVVTGHARDEVEAALAGFEVDFVHNPDFADGLATSLRTGVAALSCAGAVVLLGDMPEASAAVVDALIASFETRPGALAAVALHDGRRGNPVLLGRGLFGEVARLSGDEGARRLLADCQRRRSRRSRSTKPALRATSTCQRTFAPSVLREIFLSLVLKKAVQHQGQRGATKVANPARPAYMDAAENPEDAMTELHKNYIAGEWVEGDAVTRNINPSDTNDVVGEYAQAERRAGRGRRSPPARAALPGWARSTPQERHDVLLKVGARDPRPPRGARPPAVARGRQDAARGDRRGGARRPDLRVLRRRGAAHARREIRLACGPASTSR